MRGLHSDRAPEAGNSHLVWGLQEMPQASPLGRWQQRFHLEMVAGWHTEQPNERPTGSSKQGQTIREVWSPESVWVSTRATWSNWTYFGQVGPADLLLSFQLTSFYDSTNRWFIRYLQRSCRGTNSNPALQSRKAKQTLSSGWRSPRWERLEAWDFWQQRKGSFSALRAELAESVPYHAVIANTGKTPVVKEASKPAGPEDSTQTKRKQKLLRG